MRLDPSTLRLEPNTPPLEPWCDPRHLTLVEPRRARQERDVPTANPNPNPGPGPASAVIARTDPHEQESVVLLPELEGLVPG